jgi:hypothetical protein
MPRGIPTRTATSPSECLTTTAKRCRNRDAAASVCRIAAVSIGSCAVPLGRRSLRQWNLPFAHLVASFSFPAIAALRPRHGQLRMMDIPTSILITSEWRSTIELHFMQNRGARQMFSPYEDPRERCVDVLKTARLLPFVTYGIVNPLGPTLCGILLALDHEKRTSEVLSFYLNPFSQSITAVGEIWLPKDPNDLPDEVATIIEKCNLFPLACFTLVIPSGTFPVIGTKRLVAFLLSRVEGLGRQLDLIRRFPANPWDRISEAMRTARARQREATSLSDDLREYVNLIVEPAHTKVEHQAFMAAWDGSIEFASDTRLVSMPLSEFVTISQQLIGD